jgi:enoyl-CoA hydratase/carnithine racemase
VLTLSLSNPPRNMLSFDVLGELDSCLDAAAADDQVNVVVLASAQPGYFAAHADLEDIAALREGPNPAARVWTRVMRQIEGMPPPVIAAVDGQAWGGGWELALSCTLRVCSSRAHFAFPETGIGLIPGAGGTQRLSRAVGMGRAAELVLSGRIIDAAEAASLGLVDAVLDEPFGAAAAVWAHRIAARPRGALAAAKRALVEGARLPFGEGLRLEAELFAERLGDPATTLLVDAARGRYANASPGDHVFLDADSLSGGASESA